MGRLPLCLRSSVVRGDVRVGPDDHEASCHAPPVMLRLMLSHAMPSSVRAAASGPASTGRKPRPLERVEHRRLGGGVVRGDVAVGGDARDHRIGLARREQRVERLDDTAPGQPLLQLLGDRRAAGLPGPAWGGWLTSTTTLPASSSPISVATEVEGRRRHREHDDVRVGDRCRPSSGPRSRPARRQRRGRAPGVRAAIVTSWPARVNDVVSALPTLPAPMIATFMAVPPGLTIVPSSSKLC